MESQKVRKNMTFPLPMVKVIEKRASKIGYDFQDYVYHLLAKEALIEVEKGTEDERVEKGVEEEIKQGLRDYDEGKYTRISGHKGLDKHLEKLKKKSV